MNSYKWSDMGPLQMAENKCVTGVLSPYLVGVAASFITGDGAQLVIQSSPNFKNKPNKYSNFTLIFLGNFHRFESLD